VYVLGSSTTFNSSALLSLNRSLNQNFTTPDFVDYSAEIDKRDGFPAELLHARYVIVASPVQTAFNPAEQQIVVAPEREFLQGSGIAAAFEKLPYEFTFDAGVTYELDGDVKVDNLQNTVKVFIYRKTRNITRQQVGQLSDALREMYPNRPYIFNPPPDIN